MPAENTWPSVIATLTEHRDLTPATAEWAMDQIVTGQADPAAIGGFLIALKGKGESVDEVDAFVRAILNHAVDLPLDRVALDIVGTGGDLSGTVNISSMASLVIAATGQPVIKHGNRAVSSRSGASDFFEALGVDITANPADVARVFGETGIGFAFAPIYHGGFRFAAPVRKVLGVPTVFNFLGPLSNPARPHINVLGVADAARVRIVADLLAARRDVGLVFRGEDGLDELTTTGPSLVFQIDRDGELTEYHLDPKSLGIAPADLADLVGGDAEENAAIGRAFLAGETGSVRDIVLLNAAAGLVAADLWHRPETAEEGIVERFERRLVDAATTVDSGAAQAKLDEWVAAFDRSA